MNEVLYIGATWCGPCKMMKPVVGKLQEEGYNINYYDADEHTHLLQKYNVTNVPTFIKVHGGDEVARFSGIKNIHSFREWLDKIS